MDTATYTYVGGDSGVVTLTITDTTAETINISAADNGNSDDDTEGTLVVAPAAFRDEDDNPREACGSPGGRAVDVVAKPSAYAGQPVLFVLCADDTIE